MPFSDSVKFVKIIREEIDELSAGRSDVRVGKKFIGNTKILTNGTLNELNVQNNIVLSAGQSYNIPKDVINNKEFNIVAKPLSEETVSTATSADILADKTAWVNGVIVAGSMTNNGSWTPDELANAGDTVMIPQGYHDGTGSVEVKDLSIMTESNATASSILSGYSAWVNGNKINGNISIIQPENRDLNPGDSYTIPRGFHYGTERISSPALSTSTPGNATSNDIISGKKAWVNGSLIVGNVPIFSRQTIELQMNRSYIIPYGFHPGTEEITQNVPFSGGVIVAPGYSDQTIDVNGKYMTGNITVTGIRAYNVQFIGKNDQSSSIMKKQTINIDGSTINMTSGRFKILSIPIDNWHDGETTNVYKVDVEISNNSSYNNPHTNYSFTLLCTQESQLNNSLPFFSSTDGSTFTLKDSSKNIKYRMVNSDDPNSHTLYLYSNTTSFAGMYFKFTVTEMLSFRRFGDSHDI